MQEVEVGSSTLPKHSSPHRSRSPPVIVFHAPAAPHPRSFVLSSPSMLPSHTVAASELCNNTYHLTISCPVLLRDALSTLSAIRADNMKNLRGRDRNKRPTRPGKAFVLGKARTWVHALPRTDSSLKIDSSFHPWTKARQFCSRQRISRPRQKSKNHKITG